MLIIGKITGTHGLRGDVKVLPLTDYPERYLNMKQVFVGTEKEYITLPIESVKQHKNMYLFKFANHNDINAVEGFKNKFLLVSKEEAVELPEDTYFIHDIIGLDAFLDNGEYLGKVKEIFPTGSNDVYVIEGNDGEKLIPALKSVVSIDLANKKMTVNNMPGLISGAEEV